MWSFRRRGIPYSHSPKSTTFSSVKSSTFYAPKRPPVTSFLGLRKFLIQILFRSFFAGILHRSQNNCRLLDVLNGSPHFLQDLRGGIRLLLSRVAPVGSGLGILGTAARTQFWHSGIPGFCFLQNALMSPDSTKKRFRTAQYL